MTTPTRGYYGVVQFCPDPSRSEGANIGVVLLCPDHEYLGILLSSGNTRIAKFFGRDSFDAAQVQTEKRALAARIDGLKEAMGDDAAREAYEKLVATRANRLRITSTRTVKVIDPEEELESLFQDLVQPSVQRKQRDTDPFSPLRDALDGLRARNLVQRNVHVTDPRTDTRLTFPYAYVNGSKNLIKPISFPNAKGRVEALTSVWALRGKSLREHRDPAGVAHSLIVVSAFEPGTEYQVRRAAAETFRDFAIRQVTQDGIPDFVDEVAQSAHLL